jgi:hypothetical protein
MISILSSISWQDFQCHADMTGIGGDGRGDGGSARREEIFPASL